MRISRNRCQYCRMQRCIMAGMSHEGKYAYSRPVGLDFNVNRFSYIPRVSVTKKNCAVDIPTAFYVPKLVHCIIHVHVNVGKEEIHVLI